MKISCTFCKYCRSALPAIAGAAVMGAFAAPPPDLPGQEITQQYMQSILPADSLKANPPDNLPESADWFDRAQRTWDAPFLSQQIAEDVANIPMGKGAIFIPRMSTDANLEPDVDILDSTGAVVLSDKVGKKICLMEGNYTVLLGSGSHRQLIARKIRAVESKINPLIPDWCCLAIDVVDQNNLPMRGEYEITRIDEFEPFGHGYGRDQNLGEELKTWVLKPGIYKIFSVGLSYNTLVNFITVRLLPGEMTHLLLVENSSDFKIISGGTTEVKLKQARASHFKYGLDIGGSVLFSSNQNYVDTTANKTTIALLANTGLQYKNGKHEFNFTLRLNEGLNFTDFKIAHLNTDLDEFHFTALYIWRFLHWFGPYGRFEVLSTLFPQYHYFDDQKGGHYYLKLNPDSSLSTIDSVNATLRLAPSFSPFTIQAGLGGNLDVVKTRFLETKFRAGFGFSREASWSTVLLTDSTSLRPADTAFIRSILPINAPHAVVRRAQDTSLYSYGPEADLNALARVGRWATIETELQVLIPLQRLSHPDYDWTTTISWRIIPPVTLDYQYTYQDHPSAVLETERRQSLHRILLRFSYTSR
ncbi:MAG: hypothetical protein PHC61_14715 [Chitinivibrionales bacterium]|nr:hypothetical protein [Chitinivibrionales bacterium]